MSSLRTGETPKRPKVRKPRPWSFPEAFTSRLPNGVTVLVYHRPGQYVVSAGLALDIPLSAEAPDREGVAALCTRTLDEGTDRHPGTAFAEAVEQCGAILEAAVGYSHTHVYMDVPGSHLAEAIPLMVEAVVRPTLADADVERHRALRVAQIEQQLANSGDRANHALRRALTEPRYRASRMRDGEPTTLAQVTGEDVRAYHHRFFGPVGSTLVLAGDFPGDVMGVVEDAFGAWANPDQEFAEHEDPAPRPRGAYLIDRPGSVQADLRLGRFTIDRQDHRWADLQIASYAVGGAFLSRLNRVLREERGFTYGVGLVNAPMRQGGFSYVQGSFRNDVVGEALQLVPQLMDVSTDALTEDEVTNARTYLAGTAPLQYATASGVCNGVMHLLAAGLTTDFIDSTHEAYSRVTPESAGEVLGELLPDGTTTLVVVGDAGTLEPSLRAAGWDPQVVPVGEWV